VILVGKCILLTAAIAVEASRDGDLAENWRKMEGGGGCGGTMGW